MKKGSFFTNDRIKLIVLLVSCGAFVALGLWGYRYYQMSVNERAQTALAAEQRAYAEAKTPEAFKQVSDRLAVAAQQQSGSDLAPFFLTLRSEALRRSGDHAEALAVLRTALDRMGKENPLWPLYAVQEAVLMMDTHDTAAALEGQKKLQALADDHANLYRGLAGYYLWHALWMSGDIVTAEAALTKLKSVRSGLPWGEVAQAQIDVAS